MKTKFNATKEMAAAALQLIERSEGGAHLLLEARAKRGGVDFRKKRGARLLRAFSGDKAAANAYISHIVTTSEARVTRRRISAGSAFTPERIMYLRDNFGPKNGAYAKKYIYVEELNGARLCSPVYGLRDYNGDRIVTPMTQRKCEIINKLMGW